MKRCSTSADENLNARSDLAWDRTAELLTLQASGSATIYGRIELRLASLEDDC